MVFKTKFVTFKCFHLNVFFFFFCVKSNRPQWKELTVPTVVMGVGKGVGIGVGIGVGFGVGIGMGVGIGVGMGVGKTEKEEFIR